MATDPNEKYYPDEPPPPYPGLSSTAGLPPHGPYLPQYPPPLSDLAYPPPEPAHGQCSPCFSPPPNSADGTVYPPPPNAYAQAYAYQEWKSGEGVRYQQEEYAPRVVITSQPVESSTVYTSRGRQPSNYLALSIVTCLCFSPLCGLIAIFFSVMSQNSYISGDEVGASKNGKIALALCVAGIVFSTIIIVIMFSSGQSHFHT